VIVAVSAIVGGVIMWLIPFSADLEEIQKLREALKKAREYIAQDKGGEK